MSEAFLGFDCATPATAVAFLPAVSDEPLRARHEPAPGERPGHASRLLGLCAELLGHAGLSFADLGRIAVGTGPGTFTGLRIAVATARALAHASGAPLAGVSSLAALAEPVREHAVLAVLDARRGEAFVAGYLNGVPTVPATALSPDALARLAGREPWRAVGEGALRFRADLEAAGAHVPPDDDPHHRIDAAAVCRLGRAVAAGPPEAVVPDYLRLPDAELTRRVRA